MLTQFQPVSYEHKQVTNETIASTGTVPETFTVSKVFQGLDEDSETIQVYDNATGNVYTLDKGSDYEVVSYENGEFNITNDDPDDDSTAEIDSTGDEYRVDYTYNEEGTSTFIISDGLSALETFGSFFTVIVVVGIGAVLLILLQMFRSAGAPKGRSMA